MSSVRSGDESGFETALMRFPSPAGGGGPGLVPLRARHKPAARRRALPGALVVAAFVSIATAQADPGTNDFTAMDLEQLMAVKVPMVYGASKHEQKVTEAPSDVSIITQDDIQKYGYRTLADVLRSVRGFYVTYDRGYTFIGMRGVNRPGDYGGRVLITVDGHRLNEPVFDSAFNGNEFPLDVDLIDRVEVIRGPGSSLYGNNAFFTVINVVTRRPEGINGAEASGAAAGYDTYTGRLTYGKHFSNGLNLMVSGSLLDSAGHKTLYYPEFASVNNGVARDLDGEWAKKVFASVSWGDFTLEGLYGDRRKDLPTAAYGSVFDASPNWINDERAYAELKYHHEFANEWQVMGRLFFDHYRYDALAPFDYSGGTGPPTFNRDFALAQSRGGELQVSKTFLEDHHVTFGGEFNDDFILRLKNQDVAPPMIYSDVRSDAGDFGLYLQDEFSIRTNLILNAGVRYDHFTTFGDTVDPRAALIYSPWDETSFKAIYGQAFRGPNAYEFSYIAPGYAANPDLKPEHIRSGELVWEQGFATHWRFSGSLFYNQMDDLITQQIDPGTGDYIFKNTDSVDAKGAGLELEGTWANGLRGRMSYSFADATDNATGQRLSNSPQHLGKFNLAVPLYAERIFAGLEVQASSSRRTVRGNEAGAYAVCNLTLFSHQLVKGLDLSASVYNLFDRRFSDPVSLDFTQDAIQQDGRSFRVKLTYHF